MSITEILSPKKLQISRSNEKLCDKKQMVEYKINIL